MRVLLVEDNPDDVASVERLAALSQPAVCLVAIQDGQEAASYLSRPGTCPPE